MNKRSWVALAICILFYFGTYNALPFGWFLVIIILLLVSAVAVFIRRAQH